LKLVVLADLGWGVDHVKHLISWCL